MEELEQRRLAAVHLVNSGDAAGARRVLIELIEHVRHLPPSHERDEFQAMCLMSLAVPTASTEGIDTALAVLEAADQTLQGHPDAQGTRVRIMTQRVYVLTSGARVREAVACSEPLLHVLPSLQGQQRCHISYVLATMYIAATEMNRARPLLQDMVEHSQQQGMPQYTYVGLHHLAELDYHDGRIPEALEGLREARRHSPSTMMTNELGEASALMSAGLITDAKELLLETLERIPRGNRHDRDLARLFLAEAYAVSGNASEARRYAVSAERGFRRRGHHQWRLRARWVRCDVPGPRQARVRVEQAQEWLQQARREGHLMVQEPAMLYLAEAYVGRGQWEEARRCLRWLKRRSNNLTMSQHLRLAALEVRSAEHEGNGRKRSIALRNAAARVATIRLRTSSLDLRTACAVHAEPLVELDAASALQRGPAALVASVERWRMAMAAQPQVRPPSDEQTRHHLHELRELERRGEKGGARAAELTRLLRQAELRQRGEVVEHLAEEVTPWGFGELRDVAREHDADLVLLCVVGGVVHAVNVAAGRPQVVTVGPLGPMLQAVAGLRDAAGSVARIASPRLASMMRGSLLEAAAQLDDMLLGPLRLRRSCLVVVPTRELVLLPWGYLPGCVGKPVSVVASATQWATRGVRHRGGVRAGVIHGPGLESQGGEVQAVRASWGDGEPSPLRPGGVRDEVGTPVGRHTTGVMLEAMRTCDVVHVSAHGVHHAENPLFSQIQLEDGPLFAFDLDAQALRASLVVLASCEVGASTLRPLDQPLGLTASLQYCGVATVVAATTAVNDAESAQMMALLHGFMARGTPCAEAVAAAAEQVGGSASSYVTLGAPWVREGAR